MPSANQAKKRIAEQTSSVCLIREKVPAPCSVFEPDLVFQRLFEEFQRGKVARAQPEAFQIEHLHEGDEPEQRDGDQTSRERPRRIMTAPAR